MLPGGRPALLLLLLTGLAVPPLSAGGGTVPLQVPLGAPPCPCSAPALCRPITTTREREVFGFAVSRATPYDRYDWAQLTTAAWNDDPALMCTAHAAGARVVLDGRGANPAAVYGNRTARAAWLAAQVRLALDNHMDGINFDMEDPLAPGDPLALEYSALVAEAAEAFHAAIPGSQVSVDVPWSPHCIDGRCFDWAGLANAADILFVMAYDMQSQVWGRCVASANSPLPLVRRGLQEWIDLGVPRSKLVLGLPCAGWSVAVEAQPLAAVLLELPGLQHECRYGYRYPCINEAFLSGQSDICELPPVEFRGCPCSDAAGTQFCYSSIQEMIRRGRDSVPQQPQQPPQQGAGASLRQRQQAHSARGASSGSSGAAGAAGPPRPALDPLRGGEEEEVVCEQPAEDPLQGGSAFARCHLASDPGRYPYQMWFDTPASLARKYRLAAELGLRGVGMWELDCLDYQCEGAKCRADTAAMWGALAAFTNRSSSTAGGAAAAEGGGGVAAA